MDDGIKIAKKMRRGPGKPFAKGWKGGPGRPPREQCVSDIFRVIGSELDEKTKRTKLVSACLNCFQSAENGSLEALKFIIERTEGKVKDRVELETRQVPSITVSLPTPEAIEAFRNGFSPDGIQSGSN
jgi:hypothetical protein